MFDTCPVCKCELNENDEACPRCGFKLIGSTQEFSPVKINENSSNHKSKPPQNKIEESSKKTGENKPISATKKINECNSFILVLTGLQKGSKFVIRENDIILGRDVNSTIFLNDMTVSRKHALIYFEKGCHIIKDLGSFNGVWVNNKNVSIKTLEDGDLIQLGNFLLEYHR